VPTGNFPLFAMNQGEVSKIALVRVDQAKMRLAAACQVNWLPFVLGPMMLRPGLEFVGEVLSDLPAKLVRFVFAKNDTALIELTNGVMRAWINDVLVERVAVATAISDPSFAGGGSWSTADTTAGCTVSIGAGVATLTCGARGGLARFKQTIAVASGDHGKEHGIRVVVTNGPVTLRAGSSDGLADYIAATKIDTGTHSLVCTPAGSVFLQIESTDVRAKTLTSVSIEDAGVLELPTPWGTGDLPNVRYDQSGDIVFTAAYGLQQYKIERRGSRPGARGWSVVLYRSDDGPFQQSASVKATFAPSVYDGNGTLSSDQPYFTPQHVGCLFRLFTDGQNRQVTLGARDAFSDAVRVVGVGTASRNYNWTVSGTYVGILTFQRSFDGADLGFVDIQTQASGFTGTVSSSTGGTGGTPNLDNAICWERIGFKPGTPVAGAATIGAGGSSYIVGNTLTLVGGSGTPATYRVASVDGGGGVTAVTLLTPGLYTALPSNPAATTGGAGTGCTLNVTAASTDYTSGSASVVSTYAGGGGFGICRVTGYNDPKSVNIDVLQPFASLQGTQDWVEADWSSIAGWPTTVSFHEGRLGWAGRDEIWLSHSDSYTGFADIDSDGNAIGDAGAINEAMGSGAAGTISWLLSLTRLQIGREQSIGSARSSNFDQPLTPTDVVIRDSSDQGAARLAAFKSGKRGIFVGQNNRVYELAFTAQEMDYDERDLTRLNLDIVKPGFVDGDKATHPDKQIVLPRTDGQAAVLLYDVKDEVEAWWRIQTLGIIENYCVLPGDGIEDAQYFVVRRAINGVTRRFIEKMATRDACVGGAINQQLDCHLVYRGAAVNTVQLAWLPNTLVSVWADGAAIGTQTTDGSGNCAMPDGKTHSNIVVGLAGAVVRGFLGPSLPDNTAPDQVFTQNSATLTVGAQFDGYPAEVFADIGGTGRPKHVGTLMVSGGQITLPNLQVASSIVACLGYVAPFMSAKLAYAAALGTALTQKKRIPHCGLIMFDTDAQGVRFGQRFDVMDAMPQKEAEQLTPAGTIWSEYDEAAISVPGEWDTDARLCLLAQAPRPCTIGGVVVGVDTSG